MLSLPPLTPKILHVLSPQPLYSSSNISHNRQPGHQNPNPNVPPTHQPQHFQASQTQRTLLSVLHADENTILLRKESIRRFGAGWLRPVGVGKTLQGLDDERIEKEEAEASGRDFAPTTHHSLPSTTPNTPVERDLDDLVPDADEADTGWIDEEGDDDLDTGGGMDEDLDVEDDDIPMDGEAEAEYEQSGDVDGDLDANVPEADVGGYEHTDTEVEDESSFDIEPERRGVLDRSIWGGAVEEMHIEVEGAMERVGEARARRSRGRGN